MFIGAGSLVLIYILFGFYTMSICAESNIFSNPLTYGLVIIFWPIAVIAGLCWIMCEWIKSVGNYYKKKGEK